MGELALFGGRSVLPALRRYAWPRITDADIGRVVEAMRRGEISVNGREGEIEKLEERFKALLGVRYALAVSSGTAALHSAYFALGLGPDDEVLAPTYTFFATVMALVPLGIVPVLVDADPRTGNIDLDDLERKYTSRTTGIVVTHNFGIPVDMARVMRFARSRGLRVVEDCSHAHGTSWHGRSLGTFGDAGAFSLQANKVLPAGEGGMLVTNDPEVYERAILFGHPRERAEQEIELAHNRAAASTGVGLMYRMHPLAAALANSQMDRLEQTLDRRGTTLGALSAVLRSAPAITPPAVPAGAERVTWYSYRPLYLPEEAAGLPIERFVEAVRAEGVPLQRPKSPPLHLEPYFQTRLSELPNRRLVRSHRTYRHGDLPNSEAYAGRVLRFPSFEEDDGSFPLFGEAIEKVVRNANSLCQPGPR
jgi:dTDP-4-amino-4,6-dideoxygalactose transaminase